MKIKCFREQLAAALGVVIGAVPTKTYKDILKHVKLVVSGGEATLIGTDHELGIRHQLAVIDAIDGEALLPTSVTSIVRELQDESVEIEVVDDALWIRTSHSESRLSVKHPAAEFPDVAAFKEENYHIVQGTVLKSAIQRTLFAADVEITRYALTGVCLEMRPNEITLAATDSRRLAVAKGPCCTAGAGSVDSGKVVPSKAMSLIENSIQDADQEVHIAIRRNEVLVRSGASTIYARLVEGRFPRYQDVIPSAFRMTMSVSVGQLLSSLQHAMLFTNDKSWEVDFDFSPGTLTLKSTASDIGTSKIDLPVVYDGEKIGVAFDPKFVADLLKVLDNTATVALHIVDPTSAAVFKTDENYTYVLMPRVMKGKNP